ncbi:MAG: CUB domain-containing protein, partial [Bacteroidia bacterium]
DNKTQTFVSNTGNRIAFKFTQFFLASKYDYLEAYDGPNRNYPMMGRYYYGDHPDSLISSGDAITFRFYSSNSDNASGWAARISCGGPILQRIDLKNNRFDTTCNAVYYDNGGNRRNYYDNTNATNTICASDTGKFLNATFNYWGYDLRPEDTLAIYDGTSVNASPLAKHTFSDKPEPLQAKSGCLTFNFTSNKTINSRGWQAFIECDSTVLKPTEYRIEAGVRYTCNGTFTDPGGATANYPGSANKTQTFITPTNGRLAFIFRDFDLDYRYDYLNIYDGPSTSSKLIGSYRENNSPDTVISTGKALTFHFYANNIYQERGWIADIHCIEDLYTPKITTKKVQCKGDSMVLNAKTISGVEYQWFGPNGFYSTKAKPVVHNIDTKHEGTYKLVVKSWGRVSDTAYIKINVFAKPSSPTISVKGNNSICTGDSVELISSALVRNIWSNGDTTKSIFVSKQGTYNTVYVGFSGCKSKPSSGTTINLLKTPSQPKILVQGDTLLCEGDTLELISSQNILNRWSTGDSTQTLKVSKAGIYSVKAVGFNGCFSKTSTPITVKTLKSPAAPIVTANGNTDLCFGDSTLLTASSIEPIIWSNGKTARQIWVKTTGNISANAIGSNGCASIESNVIGIDVSPYYEAPKITAFGNLNFCEGDTIELNSSYSSGNQWSNGKTSQILKIYTSEKVSVKFRDAKGCESKSSDTLILNMIERPGFPIITEFIKDSLKASTNAESYDWFYEGNKLGLKTQKISAPATGSYTVIAYANNCPSIESMPYSFTHSNISKNNSAHISLFPNPTTGLIELKSDLEIEAITVSSVNGNIIQKVYDPKTKTIDLSMFDKGTYIIQIISNQKVYQKAVVKY